MSKPRLALIGCGYWGQNLLRRFMALRKLEIRTICDFDLAKLARLKRLHPTLKLEPDYRAVLSDARVDAVVIATPASTHYAIARKALLAGKHVFLEPPLATTSAHALELIELAERRARVLMVDYNFLYTGAVQALKRSVDRDELGDLLFFDSLHMGPGGPSDLNVLWDLGAQDFAILDHLYPRDPASITASGACHLGLPFENIAYASAAFRGFSATLHFNWLSPVQMHRILVGGSRGMALLDEHEGGLKIYRRVPKLEHESSMDDKTSLFADHGSASFVVPIAENREALTAVAQDFAAALTQQRRPVADGQAGYRVVRLLEAAQRSMTQSGRSIELGATATLFGRPGKAAVI